jgi:C4-dicarboxylate-specific signal transduction histidine kinase
MPDGSVKHVHVVAHAVRDHGGQLEFTGALMDVTAAKQAGEELHKTQAELAHVARVTTLGELTASIAHEVNQPLAAVVTNAEACLRWLGREAPNLDEARRAVEWIVKDGNRAAEVIRHIRALTNKTDTQKAPLDINDVVNEVIPLVQRELLRQRVSLRAELAPALSAVLADRVQLQQVILNLVMNGIEAMQPVTGRPRQLVIRSDHNEVRQVLVAVEDRGVGISAENADRLFNAFFTTKSGGMGMGLAICRSIVEAHGGRISAANNAGPGATFQFTLPARQEAGGFAIEARSGQGDPPARSLPRPSC